MLKKGLITGKHSLLVLLLLFSLFNTELFAQTQITIGTGTSTNSNTTYPAPYGNYYWGARHQILIRASELTAQGMVAGNITALAFNVAVPQGTALTGFTIRMMLTTNNSVSTTFSSGLTTVYGPVTYTESSGWNTHAFTTPFYWDGTSNVLVETCFNNSSWTNNAQVYYSNTLFNSVVYYRADASGVCSQATGTTSNNRPNIRFTYAPANVPPTADFGPSTGFTCSGSVSFTDSSCCGVTSWLWDFGDGNTSTQQNPTHVYASSGTYNVTLTVTNASGSDAYVYNNCVTVALGQGPVPASCSPATLGYCCGFGITNFSFAGINNTTGDGSEGYSDYSCTPDTVLVGQYYNISVSTPQPAAHNVRVWFDMNNDGVFNASSELIFSGNSTYLASGTFLIPSAIVLNTPLRLRVSADHDLAPVPGPCTDVQLGQVEDYSIVVLPNTNPPVSDFTSDATTTCTGTVNFTDISQNSPTTWLWDFGDGNTSTLQNPSHTYSSNGTFTVTLISSNIYGGDTLVMTNYITVAAGIVPVAASCSPATFSYCCGYGIYNVTFHNSINNSSGDGSESYMDFTCSQRDSVIEGQVYPISLQTSPTDPQDTRVWIDLNNDGAFSQPNELVFTALNTFNPSGNITIPSGAVLNTPLRMRVYSDYSGSNPAPCTAPVYGQIEDYTLIILPNPLPPVADFTVDETLTCGDGTVTFTDLSLNVPTSWSWDFGDGNTSAQQNPTHTYTLPGTYSVQLTATNAFGSDVILKSNYVSVILDTAICDTVYVNMPVTGTGATQTSCFGVLFDSGGPTQDYIDNASGVITISPTGAASVTLNFSYFDYEWGYDTLYIYNGPTTSSPLIGAYTGNALPGSGTISSTGPSITMKETSDPVWTRAGFRATWTCTPVSVNETAAGSGEVNVHPNPSSGIFNIEYMPVDKQNVELEVYCMMGARIYHERIGETNGFHRQLDLSREAKGVYILKVTENGKQVVRRIIVQ